MMLGAILWIAGIASGTFIAALAGAASVLWVLSIAGGLYIRYAISQYLAIDSFEAGSVALSWLLAIGLTAIIIHAGPAGALAMSFSIIGGILIAVGIIRD